MAEETPEPYSLALTNQYPEVSVDTARHEHLLCALLRAANETQSELSVTLVDDNTIADLNQTYRSMNAATDVLSFSMREGEMIGEDCVLGDIIISLDTAKRQAEQRSIDLGDEVDELLFHGMIHLLGHDHYSKADREAWLDREAELLSALSTDTLVYTPKGLPWMDDSSTEPELPEPTLPAGEPTS